MYGYNIMYGLIHSFLLPYFDVRMYSVCMYVFDKVLLDLLRLV